MFQTIRQRIPQAGIVRRLEFSQHAIRRFVAGGIVTV
jgi:hypothetical protein